MFFGRYLLLGAGLMALAGCDAGPITCVSDKVQDGVIGYAERELDAFYEMDLGGAFGLWFAGAGIWILDNQPG